MEYSATGLIKHNQSPTQKLHRHQHLHYIFKSLFKISWNIMEYQGTMVNAISCVRSCNNSVKIYTQHHQYKCAPTTHNISSLQNIVIQLC